MQVSLALLKTGDLYKKGRTAFLVRLFFAEGVVLDN